VNNACDRAEEVRQAKLQVNQDYLDRVMSMSRKKDADVQSDSAYTFREKAK
jgi:hypothetical protein